MVEEDIATYIAANTDLVAGVDLFTPVLPSEERDGVTVKEVRKVESWGKLTRGFITLLAFYEDYVVGRARQDELSTLMNNYRGTVDGSWTISSEVECENLGLDRLNRYVLGVSFIACYS